MRSRADHQDGHFPRRSGIDRCGDRQRLGAINRKRLAAAIGAGTVKLATAETVLKRTGYPAGGVSPVGIRDPAAHFVIDSAVLAQTEVYGGAGTEDDLVLVAVADLMRVTNARTASITNSPVTSPVLDT